ncbi:hypothetical protein NE237_003675 [Protea cynaroides]|uniref:Uncharacterized protein n=1 Tax=Protea cynaroides TaxID=273540 RepID=A0A9Q0KHT8_9MAGN|nr:hypothetical protein NE237_003675 [Protea cynaroides]
MVNKEIQLRFWFSFILKDFTTLVIKSRFSSRFRFCKYSLISSVAVGFRKMVELLFEDIFTVTRLDPDGKKFDKVSRIEARSEQFDMYMQLDVNTEIYPLHVGEKFTMVLANTLSLDGTPNTGYFTQGNRKSLADKFEYVMHGKLFKISEEGSGANVKVEIYVSYGGLLMLLKGDPSNAANFELDQRLFLLMRKV